jgi:Holliday junction resolvase
VTGGAAPRAAGDRFERACVMRLRALGYLVIRSAGSLGPADLVAMRADTLPLLVNCKITDTTTTRTRTEFHDIAIDAGALPIIATKPNRAVIRWQKIAADGSRGPYDIGGLLWPNPL